MCHYCDKTSDLRPYGPSGAMVCFECAMSRPDRRQTAEQMFYLQAEACGPVAVIGAEVGPYPLEHHVPREPRKADPIPTE